VAQHKPAAAAVSLVMSCTITQLCCCVIALLLKVNITSAPALAVRKPLANVWASVHAERCHCQLQHSVRPCKIARLIPDPELALQLKLKWSDIRALMSKISGYQRRRKLTNQPLNQIEWLFRRHVLGHSLEKIAEDAICKVGTIRDTVKELRQVMRLRVRESVTGRSRRRRLPRLVEK